jgi:hypothetical protein
MLILRLDRSSTSSPSPCLGCADGGLPSHPFRQHRAVAGAVRLTGRPDEVVPQHDRGSRRGSGERPRCLCGGRRGQSATTTQITTALFGCLPVRITTSSASRHALRVSASKFVIGVLLPGGRSDKFIHFVEARDRITEQRRSRITPRFRHDRTTRCRVGASLIEPGNGTPVR